MISWYRIAIVALSLFTASTVRATTYVVNQVYDLAKIARGDLSREDAYSYLLPSPITLVRGDKLDLTVTFADNRRAYVLGETSIGIGLPNYTIAGSIFSNAQTYFTDPSHNMRGEENFSAHWYCCNAGVPLDKGYYRLDEEVVSFRGMRQVFEFTGGSANQFEYDRVSFSMGGDFKLLTSAPRLPPKVPPAPQNYILPLRATEPETIRSSPFKLVTEPGGRSTDGGYNEFHDNDGHYSLDISSSVDADVVAGAAGRVVYVLKDTADENGFGPVVIIYNGNGYYSKYQEFSSNPSVEVGQFVEKGEKIGDYIVGQTGDTGRRALHFQVKYNPDFTASCLDDASCPASPPTFAGKGNSPNIPEIASVTLNGQRLSEYKINNPIPMTSFASTAPVFSASLTDFSTINTTVSGSTARLQENSPAYLWSDFNVPAGVRYLAFDFSWLDRGDGDYLTVFFGDKLLFNAVGTDFPEGTFLSSGLLALNIGLSDRDQQLLFWLNSVGNFGAQLEIRNVNFYSGAAVPEAQVWVMMLIGFGTAGWRFRRGHHHFHRT